MRTHTNNFKTEINKLGRQIKGKIIYYNSYNVIAENENNILTENDLQLISENVNYNDAIEISEENVYSIEIIKNGNLLQSLMKQCNFESSVDINIGSVIRPYLGLLINGSYEYLDYGNFIINSKEYNFDTKTWNYICYDKMLFSMIKYKKLNGIVYPITIKEYLKLLCNKVGLDFEESNFVNYNQLIYEDVYKDKVLTFRDIFDEISKVAGGNLLINDNDKLAVCYPNTTNDSINENYLRDTNVKASKKIGVINSVAILDSENNLQYVAEDIQSIKANGLTQVTITDNLLVFNGDTQTIANNIFNQLKGLYYYMNDITTTGVCYYDFLDLYNIIVENNTYQCLLLNNEITITQGIEEHIFTEELEEIETSKEDYTTSIMSDKEVQFRINKQEGEIQSRVEKNGIISAINQSSEEIKIDAGKISLEGKQINLTSENINISSDHFNIDNDGNTQIISTTSSYTGAEFKLIGQDVTNFLYSSAMVIKQNDEEIGLAGIEFVDGKGTLNLLSNNGDFISAISGQGIDVEGGNIHASGTVTGSNIQSDERLKKNIKDSSINALDIIKLINHKQFNWKDNDKFVPIGYIAQELEKIDENFVIKQNDLYYVNLLPILATATKAIQEQQEEINKLKEVIKNGKY